MLTDDAIIGALEATHGKIAFAAEKLGCTPDDIRTRARGCERIRQAIERFSERLGDAADAALWKAVLDREAWAIKLVLETRANASRDGAADFVTQCGRQTVQQVLHVLLENDDYLEFCRTRLRDPAPEEETLPAGAD